jgi:ABC-type multidrug transport system ATPase subunit
MGPSGCGKTTLLSHLASRRVSTRLQGEICIDGIPTTRQEVTRKLRYVESDDVLIGSLTVRETLRFAAQLSLPSTTSRHDQETCIEELLQMFGLCSCADTIVGTLTRKGISTGQKRRLSVAAQMAFTPQILVLDEPTSGLDSAASHSVMSCIREVAKTHNLIVICSIHQPSTSTFELFDQILLLSQGQTCYFGPRFEVRPYFASLGHEMDLYTNPAEYLLDLVNIEFARDPVDAQDKLTTIHQQWAQSCKSRASSLAKDFATLSSRPVSPSAPTSVKPSLLRAFQVVLHRSWIKSWRDPLVYWVRFVMYMGLALLMGTVWLRLPATQDHIQAFANCILFGSSFMAFMAVVYIPAFVEDRRVFLRDRENGLYPAAPFALANFLISLPYLLLTALCTSAVTYWMVHFRPDPAAFAIWTLWTFLNLLASESLVVLVASALPDFIPALAAAAMANGIWMACNGCMVAAAALPPLWRYLAYYANYQAYVFRGLATNEFAQRAYACNDRCYCQYDTPGRGLCLVQGAGVLEQQFGFSGGSQMLWVGVTVGIIVVLRGMGWMALRWGR